MAFHTLWILGEQDHCSFRWDFIFIILYFIFCRLLFVRKPRNHWVCNFILLSIFFWCFHCIYRMFLFIKCVDIYVREIFSRLNLKIITFQIFHITVCLICKKKRRSFSISNNIWKVHSIVSRYAMGADSLHPKSTLMSYDIAEQLCQDSLHSFIYLFFKCFQLEKRIFVYFCCYWL